MVPLAVTAPRRAIARFDVHLAALGALALAWRRATAHSPGGPARPIRLIGAVSPGGGTDGDFAATGGAHRRPYGDHPDRNRRCRRNMGRRGPKGRPMLHIGMARRQSASTRRLCENAVRPGEGPGATLRSSQGLVVVCRRNRGADAGRSRRCSEGQPKAVSLAPSRQPPGTVRSSRGIMFARRRIAFLVVPVQGASPRGRS